MRSTVLMFAGLALTIVTFPTLADGKKSKKSETDQMIAPQMVDLSKPLILDVAIRAGLENHQSLGIAKSQLDAAKARVTQSKSSYYPQITPSYQYSSQLSAFNVGGRSQAQQVEQSVTQIALQQLIFDMGKREQNVLSSKFGQKAVEFQVLDTRQSVIVNVSTAFYELLRQKELVKVAESSVDRAKTTLDATRAFVEAGTSPKKDILQAEADHDNAVVQLSVARNNVRLAMTILKNAMGIITPTPIMTDDKPLDFPKSEADSKAAADYIKLALDNRPDLKGDVATIDATKHTVKVAQINAGIQIDATVSEGYRIDPAPGENRSFFTTFSYPLFDGGAARAGVRSARASLEQSRRHLELARQNVYQEVEQNYLVREEARQRIGSTQSALKAAKENFAAAREAQKEGAGTIIDVITAQTLLVTAETNAVQAVYDFYTSDARLKRAIGGNDPYSNGGAK